MSHLIKMCDIVFHKVDLKKKTRGKGGKELLDQRGQASRPLGQVLPRLRGKQLRRDLDAPPPFANAAPQGLPSSLPGSRSHPGTLSFHPKPAPPEPTCLPRPAANSNLQLLWSPSPCHWGHPLMPPAASLQITLAGAEQPLVERVLPRAEFKTSLAPPRRPQLSSHSQSRCPQ